MLRRLDLFFFVLIFSILLLIGCQKHKTPADIRGSVAWLDSRSALPQFPFGTNPIYFYIYSENSHPCQVMNEKIFSRPEIIKYMNKNITSIRIRPEELDSVFFLKEKMSIRDFLKALQVTGYPSHYFFNYKGELKGVRSGYIDLREYKQLLKYIGDGYFEKYDFANFLSKSASEIDTAWGEF